MKPHHQNPRLLAARLSLPFATALVALFNLTTQSASAQSLFWDGNGATTGAGTTPTGTWGSSAFWSTSSAGTAVTAITTTTGLNDLFFSAGTDAVNPFTVTVDGSQTARLLTFQEGSVTLSGGTLITLAGGGGITLGVGVASGGVTVSTALTLNGNNTFNNTSIRTLTLDTGAFTRSAGSTLNFQGTVNSTMTGLAANTNNILGPWASFGTGAATTYAKYPVSGSTIAGLGYAGGVDGVSATPSTDVITGTGNLNYTTAATSGNLGPSASINTLRYTGGIGTLGTDTSFTTRGIMNSGTGLLTFSGPVTSGGSGTEMVVNTANNDITFGGILTGTITKTGTGTMSLGSAAHSIGGITVNQGTLVTNHSTDNSLPSVTINSGGTLRLGASNKFADNALFTINAGGTLDIRDAVSDLVGGITGSGSITTSGTGASGVLGLQGTQTFTGVIGGALSIAVRAGGDQTLTGVNTYTRSTTISGGGTLRINSIANTGTTNQSAIGAPNTTATAVIAIGSGAANGTLVYTGTGHSTNRQIQIGVNSATPVVGDTGGAIIQADGASNAALNFTGNASGFFNNQTNAATGVGADRTLTLQGASTGNNTISGIIQNNLVSGTATGTARVGVTKAQAGTWVLSGANTYSGGTTVNQGTLTVVTGGTLGATTGTLSVNNTNSTAVGTNVILNLATAVDTTTGSLSGTIATPTSGTNTATINNGGSGRNFTVNQTAAGTYAGVIAGAGSLTLGSLSTNTLTLTGTNTYTGSTSVNAGTLVINGNQSAANGAVSVTGKLTGSGTVGGATTINSAGIHNAGDPTIASGVGSQTFSSTLNYANGSIFEWDLNSNLTSSGFDTVAATGVTVGTTDTIFKVILGTTASAGIADPGNTFWNTPYGTQTWTMASIFGAAFTSGAFQTVQTSTDVSAQGAFTITATDLTWTAVPEPTSALAGILLGAGLLRRRRA